MASNILAPNGAPDQPRAALSPPADICGDIGSSHTKESKVLVAKRARWINSLPDHFTSRQIANALGVSREVVVNAAPGRYTQSPAAVMPESVHVALPELPGVDITRDRPETAPRAGIVTPKRKSLTIEERIEVIRQMWMNVRTAA